MNDPRLGAAIRALRRRRGWRQEDLALACGASQQFISKIERGFVGDTSVDALTSVAAELEASLSLELRWRAGALDRILDERHAALVGATMVVLTDRDWAAEPEVTYSYFGERGSIDILAWHEKSRAVLVVEVKSDLVSVEATLRKLDEKVRLATIAIGDRVSWRPVAVARMLVLPSTSTQRRKVDRHRRDPFVADNTGRGTRSRGSTSLRIRRRPDAA